MWRSAKLGLGASLIHTVCRWPCCSYFAAWSFSAPVCRRHPDLWLVLADWRSRFSLKVSGCVNVSSWLQLNRGMTELLWCSTDRRRHRLPTSALTIGFTFVLPVCTVRDLGIFVDCDLVMCIHVCRTVSYCFAMLRHLRSIRYLVSTSVFQSLVTALALCRLDYSNSALVGLPVYL